MPRIGIVGAGAAGAAAAFALRERVPDAAIDVDVLEADGHVGGRAATRTRNGCTYEYGANYVSSDDDRVAELLTSTLDDAGLVDVEQPVYTFDADGEVAPGRDGEGRKWTYEDGLSELARRLLDRAGVEPHRETRVERVARSDDGLWRCRDAAGSRWGPYDALVLTPPGPRTASLLGDADREGAPRSALADAAAAVPYRTVFSAVLHYPFEVDRPYYALVNADREHAVGWLAREECKPGHVPDGETLLLVQAAPDWSAARVDASPAESVVALAGHAADLLDDERLRDPDWTDHYCWRHALPDAAVDPEPLRAAEAAALYCAGDWVAGEARVHAAVATGLDVAERVAASL